MTTRTGGTRTSSRLARLPRILVAAAVLWVVGAIVALFFLPVMVEETHTVSSTSQTVMVTRTTRPIFSAAAWVEVAVAAVAAAAALGTVMWAKRKVPVRRGALLVTGWVTLGFCFLTGFSIGLFFVPVPLLLFAAAATTPPRPPAREA